MNNWHDHLQASPIGFTEAAGNFQAVNSTGHGKAGRPGRHPDRGRREHRPRPARRRSTSTTRTWTPRRTASRRACRCTCSISRSRPTRTATRSPRPTSATRPTPSTTSTRTACRTAWSSTPPATRRSATSRPARWARPGATGTRWTISWRTACRRTSRTRPTSSSSSSTEPAPRSTAPSRSTARSASRRSCAPAAPPATARGYTYADYSHVIGIPEVHSDGEIWSQTLWDLRDRLGSKVTESLVTRAMELSPSNPSYLDERNAILMADTVVFGRKYESAIWSVFAHRGMGYYAGALSGDDSSPGADFHRPPTTCTYRRHHRDDHRLRQRPAGAQRDRHARLRGRPRLHEPVGRHRPARQVPDRPGSGRPLPEARSQRAGYNPAAKVVTVVKSGTERNIAIVRDWAASTGGAQHHRHSTARTSRRSAVRMARSTRVRLPAGAARPATTPATRRTTSSRSTSSCKLPKPIDVARFAVDPSATCGDGLSASTGGFTIETSPDGTTWTAVASGTFTNADVGRLNKVDSDLGGGQRAVRTVHDHLEPDPELRDARAPAARSRAARSPT